MTAPTEPRHPELGFYTLAGHVESPRDMLDELRLAEELGFGRAFISERFDGKEACSLSGAAGAVTDTIDIVTAATNVNTRHPVVSAAFAKTMHRLTDGRFVFGIGRGIELLIAGLGLSPTTTEEMEEFASLMRALWRGELLLDHRSALGHLPFASLGDPVEGNLRLAVTAFGPNTLELAGRAFDLVVLHTFFSDETVRRAVDTVRRAAEAAGRDPEAVEVWACHATVSDELPDELRLKKTVGRLTTYLQGYGDLLVRTNRWDPAQLERIRESPVFGELTGAADAVATSEQLRRLAEVIPDEWLACAATGSPAICARGVRDQFSLGVDGVIMHGATPSELRPVVEAYAAIGG